LKAGFASRIRQGRNAAVVAETVPVKNYRRNVGRESALTDQTTDSFRTRLVAAIDIGAKFLRTEAGRRDERVPRLVVDDLRINVFSASENTQARTFHRTNDGLPDVLLPAQTAGNFGVRARHRIDS